MLSIQNHSFDFKIFFISTKLWISLAEMTFWISAFRTVAAKTTVTEKGELCFTDVLTGKNSRQHQIQDRDPMVEAAGGYTEKWHLT
jgi:hypothetical protein